MSGGLTLCWQLRPSSRLHCLKMPIKNLFWGFYTDITRDRVIGISVKVPSKAFCRSMCFLLACSEVSE